MDTIASQLADERASQLRKEAARARLVRKSARRRWGRRQH